MERKGSRRAIEQSESRSDRLAELEGVESFAVGGSPATGAEKGSTPELEERVVFVRRCAKVVKGGRRFSFSSLVVVGDHKGHVGCGLGKAREVSEAIRKAGEIARRTMFPVHLRGSTIPHEVIGKSSGGVVLLKPASPGTGVIAGGAARAILELAGVKDVLAKSLGSHSPLNVARATVEALRQLRTWEEVKALRDMPATVGE